VPLVFHVSQLELAAPNTIPNMVQLLPPPIEVNEDIKYKISGKLYLTLDKRWKC
jgi:hypothetical protein